MFIRFWYLVFFFKQKTAYEMRISDWSSDVCSSDLDCLVPLLHGMDPFLGASLGKRIAYARSITKDEAQAARKNIETLATCLLDHVGRETVVALPTTHDVAPWRASTETSLIEHRQSLVELNCAASIAGMPQITLPVAMVESAPFGLSIMGPPGTDLALLDLACCLQQAGNGRLFAKMEGYVASDPAHTPGYAGMHAGFPYRSEEHTSEIQSLM